MFLLTQNLYSALITKSVVIRATNKYGVGAKKRFLAIYKLLLKDLKRASISKKLNVVNIWFNYLPYASDERVYHKRDYWATLYEFVGHNMGDCEDYTIAKYYTLKALGIDPHRMKFTYVIYKNKYGKKIAHMVLAYLKVPRPKYKKDILILDNNNQRILPASKRRDIVKVIKMINGDTGAKSKKWKQLERNMQRKKI
ncbi:T1SS associated transglutaminase-like cysteine proteinase LapP [hydrothermal vent metagenome]|uniref:T1SS associated transglutaminase-like cysteine proteinase LapP n=1 Tax=hydrothermal vent metagenome TaxID=652676 RepID=A0A1W1D4J8_9ZZZZ